MNFEDFKKELVEKLLKINIQVQNEQIEQLYNYMNLLIEWNEKINLTAITEPSEIILKHFVDSLTISKYINKNEKIADIGTGAGFPGIPLKILNPDNDIVLIDSLNKRINFLNEVIKELGLEKIETIHGRAEELGQNIKYREKYDIAASRAVANLSTLSEYLLPFIKKSGYCICMKSANIEEEINNAKSAINILGGSIEKVEKFNLPGSEIGRSIIKINKDKNTPKKYPRKAGMPSKNPL